MNWTFAFFRSTLFPPAFRQGRQDPRFVGTEIKLVASLLRQDSYLVGVPIYGSQLDFA